jgi:hypothetical protein
MEVFIVVTGFYCSGNSNLPQPLGQCHIYKHAGVMVLSFHLLIALYRICLADKLKWQLYIWNGQISVLMHVPSFLTINDVFPAMSMSVMCPVKAT